MGSEQRRANKLAKDHKQAIKNREKAEVRVRDLELAIEYLKKDLAQAKINRNLAYIAEENAAHEVDLADAYVQEEIERSSSKG